MKKNIFIAFCLLSLCLPIAARRISEAELPRGLDWAGEVKAALRYNDDTGENIVFTTETDNYQSPGKMEGVMDAELFAYRYQRRSGRWSRVWQIFDFVHNEEFDLKVAFIPGTSPQVTDLDRDGISEVWVMYELAASSDVRPQPMKIIMYEGTTKYAMRGETSVDTGSRYEGGKYNFDGNFKNGPASFRRFAQKLWNDNIEGFGRNW